MFLRLQRNVPCHDAITGRLSLDGTYFCDTLERETVAIAAGFYPVRLTVSPRFGEVLPLLDRVYGYCMGSPKNLQDSNGESGDPHCFDGGFADSPRNRGVERVGIRIHPGNTIRDTEGCVLVGVGDGERLLQSRRTFNLLRDRLLEAHRQHEDIWIEVLDADLYPDYQASRFPAVLPPDISFPDDFRQRLNQIN